jgi:hypothetical protein
MPAKIKIHSREFGRGKPSVNTFATLTDAAAFIKARWQGAEYCDGDANFHTDYCTYELRGFTLSQIGRFSFDEGDRLFTFNSDKPVCTTAQQARAARRCNIEDCDGGHCRVCGGHFVDHYHGVGGGHVCTECDDEARERSEREADDAEARCLGAHDGFDPRAPFPHASDPHWSDPRADFAHF